MSAALVAQASATDPCAVAPPALPDGTLTNVFPLSLSDGVNTLITLSGIGLDQFVPVICPLTPQTLNYSVEIKKYIQQPFAPPPPTQTVKAASGTTSGPVPSVSYYDIGFPPGASGSFKLYLQKTDQSATFDTGKIFIVAASSDSKYQPCGLNALSISTNGNLACSFVPLTHDVARQVFGKGIADRFTVVQVIIRNLNPNLEYLLQDIRLGKDTFLWGSVDKKLMRGVQEKSETFSARATIVRLTAAGATLLTGIAGTVGNDILTKAALLTAGPVQTGLTGAIPDLTTAELARLDDLGFTTTSTVVPKNSSIPVVAFLSFAPFNTKSDYIKLDKNPNLLTAYWQSLKVEIAGIHVQQSDLGSPTIKTFVPSSASAILITKTGVQSPPLVFKVPIQGSGFTSVQSVVLISTDATTMPSSTDVTAQLQHLDGQSAIDDDVAQLLITVSTVPLTDISYKVYFLTKDGKQIDTTQQITLTVPAQ